MFGIGHNAISAATTDSPEKASGAAMKEQFRYNFNRKYSPGLFDEDGKMKEIGNHPKHSGDNKQMSQHEWAEFISVVEGWGPEDVKALPRDEQKGIYAFRKKYKKYHSIVKLHKVESYKLPGSDEERKRLLRSYKAAKWDEHKWMVCIPQLECSMQSMKSIKWEHTRHVIKLM